MPVCVSLSLFLSLALNALTINHARSHTRAHARARAHILLLKKKVRREAIDIFKDRCSSLHLTVVEKGLGDVLCGVLGMDWEEQEMKRGEEGGQGKRSAGEGGHGGEGPWWREPDGEEYSVVRAVVCKKKQCSVVATHRTCCSKTDDML